MPKLARLPANDRAPRAGANARRTARPRCRYYAFLSYSHKDSEVADWLHRELEEFHVPSALAGKLTGNGVIPKSLSPVFRDEHELAAADDLGEEIEQALAHSQFLVVLCSPEAARSRWTNAEIDLFKRTRPDGCVLAAIVAGEPFASETAGQEARECFPPALRQRYDRRGRPTGKRAEPLAADLRDEGDGRRLGLLKLVAGMLGVGLDELVQRQTVRRNRRMAWVASASLIGMVLTSGLAIAAIQARDAARDQRREAEGLVAYMVGDLKDKLEPIGKLDALDGVATRVLAYYRKQDSSELSDAGLLQRSRALSITAQVAYARGNVEQAQSLYRQALAGTAEAVRRSPDDPKRLFDHAQNVFWLGELARSRGETDSAVADYSEYKALADRLVALEPDNLKWRMEAYYGAENVGISLYNKRRFAEALGQFRNAFGGMQKLAAVEPGNGTYQKELAKLLAWLGDAERALGNLGSAISLRRREIALLNQTLASGSADVELRQSLIIAHQALGILLASTGQVDGGMAELRSAVTESERLIPVEPENALWKGYAAAAELELAKTLLATGNRPAAIGQTAHACALIASIGPAPGGVRTTCLIMRARLAVASGANGEAVSLAQQALASARQARSDDPNKDRFNIATIYRLVGDARRGSGDAPGAAQAWSKALAQLPQGAQVPPELDERALLLRRLGRADEAAPLLRRLEEMGYHSISEQGIST